MSLDEMTNDPDIQEEARALRTATVYDAGAGDDNLEGEGNPPAASAVTEEWVSLPLNVGSRRTTTAMAPSCSLKQLVGCLYFGG